MAKLTYAGVQLGFPDPDGSIQAWIERYRPLDDVFRLANPPGRVDGRDREQGQWPHAVGMPTFNWQQLPPRWRVNSLWWPTGASRFAVGLFVTNLTNAKTIQQSLAQGDGSASLVISDGSGELNVTMWALPLRPLGAVGSGTNPLVLVPLVDRRYWWQWAKCGQMFVSPTSTWQDVTSKIIEGLGASVTLPDPAGDGYDAPDWSGFAIFHENAAVALDGYAATVGQRVVATFGGSFACMRAADAEPLAQANLDDFTASAGGTVLSVPADSPGKLAVVFPRRQGGIVYQNGVCDVLSRSGPNPTAPGEVTIHTSFQADYSSRGSGADNAAAMGTLATAIARDFYAWRTLQYSASLPGVAAGWNPTGFDDYLWFLFGSPAPTSPCACEDECGMTDSPWLAETLVESMPHNLGVEENLAQLRSPTAPRTFRPTGLHRAQLTSAWQENVDGVSQATARLLYGNNYPSTGTLSQDGFDVQVFDTLNIKGDVTSGAKVWVTALAADTEMFELVGTQSNQTSLVVFQVTNPSSNPEPVLAMQGQANAVICALDGAGNYQPTAEPIVIADFYRNPGMWQASTGHQGLAVKRADGKYDITYMERPALFTAANLDADFPGSAGGPIKLPRYFQHGEKIPPGPLLTYDIGLIYPRALRDAQTFSAWNDVNLIRELLVSQQQCLYATAELTNALTYETEDIPFSDFAAASFSPFNQEPANIANTHAVNYLHLHGEPGDFVVLLWLESFEKWLILAVDEDQRDVEFVTLSANNGNGTFQTAGTALGTEFFHGKTVVGAHPTFNQSRDCIIHFTDWSPNPAIIAEFGKNYGPAKWAGVVVTSVGAIVKRVPVYRCPVGEQEWIGRCSSDKDKGGSANFVIDEPDGTPGSKSTIAKLAFNRYKAGKQAVIKRFHKASPDLLANQIECGT